MTRAGVYSDLRILELGADGAGPLVTRYFAEQGATVVRVESERRADALPAAGPELPEGADAALLLAVRDAGKLAVALDLSRAEGAALALRLVDWADVLVTGVGPGALEPLGLAPARLLERRPELIVLSLHPCERTAAGDGLAGDGREAAALAARYAAALLAAALLARAGTGRGQHLEVSGVEAVAHALSERVVRSTAAGEALARDGERDERAAPHGVYPCEGDDAWIAIAARDEAEWEALVAAMGDPPWALEPRFATLAGRRAHADELDRWLADWTRAFAPYDLMAGLQEAGVPAGVVQGPEALLRDPQLAHRGHFVRVEHPALGTLFAERSGFRLADAPGGFTSAGPRLGEHTDEVLHELLGLPPDEIAALRERGVLS